MVVKMGGGLQMSKKSKKQIKKIKIKFKSKEVGNKYPHIEQLNKNKNKDE